MNIIVIFVLFLSLFHESISYSQYLERYNFTGEINLSIPMNINFKVKYNLVEIFNPFVSFNCSYNNEPFKSVNRIIYMFKNDNKINIIKIKSLKLNSEIWVRVISITNLIPQGSTNSPDVDVTEDYVSKTLRIKSTGVIYDNNPQIIYNEPMFYDVYALPIYPAGNLNTWSSDYQNISDNKNKIVFDAINKSIETGYLQNNGVLLYSINKVIGGVKFSIASRFIRDFIVIITARNMNNSIIQYPPIYINGCLTMYNVTTTCHFTSISYPMYILLACSMLFLGPAIKFDLIHVLFGGLITFGVITVITWTMISNNIYNQGWIIYLASLGIALVAAIFFTIILRFRTKRYERGRIFFTGVVLSMILLAIIWFTPLKIILPNKSWIFGTISSIVTVILVVLLCLFNNLTLTVGGIFIGVVGISLSVSINYINASIIPLIFMDFYYLIIHQYPDWIYYTPMLIDDLIIAIVCPLSTVIIGLFFYCCIRRTIAKKRRHQTSPVTSTENYGALGFTATGTTQMMYNVVVIEQNIHQTERYVASQGQYNPIQNVDNVYQSGTELSIYDPPQPPNYNEIIKTKTIPSAPVPNYYDGPYNEVR